MKRKNIWGLIVIVTIVAIVVFSGCIDEETPTPALTPTVEKETPTPALTPTVERETPVSTPTSALPMPGKWVASAEFGGFEFVVNSTSTGISGVTYHFSNFECGGLTRSGSVGVQREGGLAPITNGQFTIVTETGTGYIRESMTIPGVFDEAGMRASGTWEAVVGATCCSGVWSASYKEPASIVTPAATPMLTPSLPIAKYTLSEAIDKGLVEAEITGMGASSGDSINLELTRLTPYTIEIEVPKGTVLLASDMAQNMVVYDVRGIRPVSKIVLDSSELQLFILEAYCLDFHKENPSSSTKFSVGTLADPRILRILDAADTIPPDIASVGAIQTAIWIVTDNVSVTELIDRFPVDPEDIDNAMVILDEANIEYDYDRLFR